MVRASDPEFSAQVIQYIHATTSVWGYIIRTSDVEFSEHPCDAMHSSLVSGGISSGHQI